MLPTESQFRGTLVASLILGITGATLDLVVPGLIPQQLVEAQESLPTPEFALIQMIGLGVAGVVLTIGGLIALFGLWFFRSWAPRWALGVTVLAYLTYPFLGYTLDSAVAATLTEVSTLLWGVVLAMVYLTPLRQRFMGTDR